MRANFERNIVDAMEALSCPLSRDGIQKHDRTIAILSALRGYWTEFGTTGEQDALLFDIGVLTEKPMHYHYWKEQMEERERLAVERDGIPVKRGDGSIELVEDLG